MTCPGFLAACYLTLAAAQLPEMHPMDVASVASNLDLAGNGVRRWLKELGVDRKGSTTERLLAVNFKGEVLMVRNGGNSSVRVDSEMDDLLLTPGAAIVMVHNHPANVGLSLADLRHLAKPGVAAIVAIGHDGSVFIASAGPRFDRSWFADEQYAIALAEIQMRLQVERPSGRLSIADSDRHTSHLISLALARAGIVQYWFKFRGSSQHSYESARYVFTRIVAGAAQRLRQEKD